MILTQTPSFAMLHRLNTLGYRSLWVNNREHLRTNHELIAVSTRYVMSSFYSEDQLIYLPITNSARVYQTDSTVFFDSPALPDSTWVLATDAMTQYGLDVVTYSTTGRVIDPSVVWLYFDPYGGDVFVCVDVASLVLCTGNDQLSLYQTMYLSDRTAPVVTSFSYTTTNAASITAAITAAQVLNANGTVVMVNGYVYPFDLIPSFNIGDRIVVICDPTVAANFDLDIDDTTTGYFSEKYTSYREIIHVPKSLNPDNRVLNHAELTILVYDPVSKRSMLLNRTQVQTLFQITHNDFTIARDVVNKFRDTLHASSVHLRVFFRFPKETRYLTDDVSRIIDLYQEDDATILKILTGMVDIDIPEWKATSLEQSGLMTLEGNFPNIIDGNVLPTYINALGYYRTAALLAQSHAKFTLTGNAIGIKKPLWLVGLTCAVTVYANGKKIPEANVRVEDRDDYSFYLSVDISDTVPLGATIDVDICEGDTRLVTEFIPTSTSPSIIMDSQLYDVYVRVTGDSVDIGTGSTQYSFKPLGESLTSYSVTQVDTGYQYTFHGPYYNYTILIAAKTGRQVMSIDLSSYLTTDKALVIPAYAYTSDGTLSPILGNPHVSVYLNGYRLVPGIDYTYDPQLINTSSIVSTDVVISNQRYLDLSTGGSNLLEVVFDSNIIVTQDVGYNRNNVFVRNWSPEMWDSSTSRLFNCGVLVQNVVDKGDYLTTTDTVRDGSPFLSEWLLPFGIDYILADYSPNNDNDLRRRVDSYLSTLIPPNPEFIKLYDSYSLYSPFIATVIAAVINDGFICVDDPNDTLFLAQFSQFDYVKERDPVITNHNPLIDRKLVDIAPHYAQQVVTQYEQLRIIRRLIDLTINNQQPTFGVTYT